MLTLGRACLLGALTIELCGIVLSVAGARAGRPAWAAAGRRAVFAVAGLLTVAFAVLEAAFLRSDFGFTLVVQHSSTTTPPFYRATAMWSAQEGSLLLWVWLLSLWSSLALVLSRHRLREATPYAQAVLLLFAAFFTCLLVFWANPFQGLSPAPREGLGLTPLLRYPSMMIHPPLLYTGYTLWTIPFAFAVGALVTGRAGADWIRATRVFALVAWLCLGVGILLGARWSYAELGWGGYWAWDPVENAALMPWLTGTAFLHSAMVQERRGMLRAWNVSLVLATGTLAILGTFLVRSGILDSIHAFGASTLGTPFLAFLTLLVAGSIALVAWRRDTLRSEHRLDSLLSREAAFLLNNLVLVALCFVIFWGTFFPLISRALTGTKTAVGPPWFDRFTLPLALALVVLSGVGPLLAWRKVTAARLAGLVALPAGVAVVVATALALRGLGSHPLALALFVAAAFAVSAVAQETWRGARAAADPGPARRPGPRAIAAALGRRRRRYGGFVVHVGIVVLLVGVAASSAFHHASDALLAPGQRARVGAFDVRYVRPVAALTKEKITLGAVLDVSRSGRHVGRLVPARAYYPSLDDAGLGRIGRFFAGEATSEVALRTSVLRDLWAAVQPDLASLQPTIHRADVSFPDANPQLEALLVREVVARYMRRPPPARFRIIDSPLVTWIWLGGVILVAGALLAVWPAPSPARRRAFAAAGREALGRWGHA